MIRIFFPAHNGSFETSGQCRAPIFQRHELWLAAVGQQCRRDSVGWSTVFDPYRCAGFDELSPKALRLRLRRNHGPYKDLLNSTRHVPQKTVLDSGHHSRTHARALKGHIQRHYGDVSVLLSVLFRSIPCMKMANRIISYESASC